MGRVVKVKWSAQMYEVPAEGALELKRGLEKLTGVPVARQKLMAKGAWVGVLKDETSLAKLKPSQQVTLIGSAEVIVAKEQPKFLEDMPDEEVAKSGMVLPAGLENLGNTCYMNSTLQCLRAVPELRSTMSGGDLPSNLNSTLATLDASTKAVAPMSLVHALRTSYPQFAQRGKRGGYAQQDAEELYSTLMTALGTNVDRVVGLDLEDTITCAETDKEPEIVKSDKVRKLICNIQGGHGIATKVDHLFEGLKLGLQGTLEKHSEILGRNAEWSTTKRISKLPPYLCVQFMRFFWKPTPNNDDHAGVKCKIMRPVSFPETLDVFDYCSKDLQHRLNINRTKFGAQLGDLDDDDEKKDDDVAPDKEEGPPAEDAMDVDDEDLKKALAMSVDADFPQDGLPADFMGNYEIFAIVTHKGRSADGGHYIGWVRQDPTKWLVFDDDFVSESNTEFVINNLKGGGDEHMAYLVFYRAKGAPEKKTKKANNEDAKDQAKDAPSGAPASSS